MGQLTTVGGWLDGRSVGGGRFIISVRLPVDAVPELERWLGEISGGEGRIVAVNSNDEDA